MMIRKDLIYTVVWLLPLMLMFSCNEQREQAKPNIVLVMCDQLRFDRLGATGDTVIKTPQIDALSHEGLLFTNAYCPSPVCAPSRASVKTGLFPPGNGVIANWVPFKEQVAGTTDIDRYLLMERLRTLGYTTGMAGKLHFVPADDSFGFDYKALHDAPYSVYADDDKHSDYIKWLKESYFRESDKDIVGIFDADESCFSEDIYRFIMGSGWRTEAQHDIPWTVERSVDFIEHRDKEKPFFLFTSFFGPHQPYLAPPPWDTLYKPDDIVLGPRFYATLEKSPIFRMSALGGRLSDKLRSEWDEQTYRKVIAAYYGQISMIDHYLGKLFDALKERGLWDNTWIIFVADHGDFNGAYGTFFKGAMYDVSAKVPLIIKPATGKGKKPVEGEGIKGVREELVSTIDLYGTILDIAGDKTWRDLPEMESVSLLPLVRNMGVSQWKDEVWSVIGADPENNLCMLRSDSLKIIRKAVSNGEPLYELYDFKRDSFETENLYGQASYLETGEMLRDKIDAWWKKQAGRYPVKVPVYAWMGGPHEATDREIRANFTDLKNKGVTGLMYHGGHDPETYHRVGKIAKEAGLKFYAWIPAMIQGKNPKLPPELYGVNGLGESAYDKPPYADYYKFLCPGREEVYQFLSELYGTIADVPEVDGIHLDYIRFPDVILAEGLWAKYGLVMDREYPQYDYCYCDHCVNEFREQYGIDIKAVDDPSRVEEWKQYRYDLITSIVNRLANMVHAKGKEINAAVFPGPGSIATRIVRQEWQKWNLDAFYPMNYNDFYLKDTKWIGDVCQEGVTAIGNRKPLYSGLFICPDPANKSNEPDPEKQGLLPGELEDAIRESMQHGAAGICLFTPERMTDEHWEVLKRAIRKEWVK